METSDHIDREWRRAKPRKLWMLAKLLIHPQTWKFLVALGTLIARAIWLAQVLTKFFRE